MSIQRSILGLAIATGVALAGAAETVAQTSAVQTGNWSVPATWSNGVPNATSATNPTTIDGGFTVTLDTAGAVADLVDVGSTSGATGTLNIAGGDLFLSDSGPPDFSPSIRLGQAAGATGNLTMSGGTVFIDSDADPDFEFADGDLMIGDNGTGTMTMTGGAFDADDEIFIGFGAGSSGTLSVSGGTISTLGRNILVGFNGADPGAGSPGAHGELHISGTGTVNSNDFLFSSFGNFATSTITQSGGTLNSGGAIVLARQGNSTYDHTGGAMSANVLVVADNFPDGLDPANPGANGTYNISGSATANVAAITWLGAFGGGVGTVNQAGGTFSSGAFGIGRDGTGTWNISSGSLTQTGTDGFTPNNHFVVGQVGGHDDAGQGTGFVNQTGGTVTINTGVFLGDFDNSEGTYRISGGTLNVTGTGTHTNPGTFEDFIGDFSVGGALASNADINRIDPANPDDAQGQALDANGTFIVSGSAATIDIAGNFLANPADKHANRKDDLPGDTNRANSAMLGFEIFNNSGTSLIDVAGVADLDGAVVDLDLMGGFVPSIGATFDLLTASGFGSTGTGTTQNVGTGEGFTLAAEDTGSFSLAVVAGGNGEILRATFLAAPVGVPGDFNNNGTVDAADYVLWRNGGPLQNDPTPGVQPADYTFWRSRFGATSGSGAGSVTAVVPEPGTWLLAIVGAALGLRRSKRIG